MNKYTPNLLLEMNDPSLTDLDNKIIAFFFQIVNFEATPEMKKNYLNRNNLYFSNQRKRRKRPLISNDPKIIQKIRGSLSKLSTSNIEKTYQNLQQILKSILIKEEWSEIAKLFYHNMVEIVAHFQIIDAYLSLLAKLEPNFPELIARLHFKISEEMKNPTQFQDSVLEEGTHKTRRLQINNGILIAHIFNKGKYSKDFISECLEKWISNIGPDNLMGLEILVKILPLIKIELNNELPIMLNKISQDKSYPARLRLLLNIPKKNF
jgi:hypothetical protein